MRPHIPKRMPVFKKVLTNAMVCDACGLSYCYEHANQHPHETCLEFIRRTSREDSVSTTFIKEQLKCKNCPRCSFPTEKNRGCNHMICVSCRADWCWLCGSDISRSATGHDPDHHYSPTNCFGCMGSQFSQGNGEFLLLDRAASVLVGLFFAVALATAFGCLSAVAALSIAGGALLLQLLREGFRSSADGDVLQALLLGPPLV